MVIFTHDQVSCRNFVQQQITIRREHVEQKYNLLVALTAEARNALANSKLLGGKYDSRKFV
jgi:hypothetical protein